MWEKVKIKRVFAKNHSINLFNLKICYAFVLINSLMFYLPQIYEVFQGGSAALNKILLVTGEIDSGGAWMQYFIRPMEFIIVATSAFFIFYKKKDIFLIIIGGGLTVAKFLATGSKTSIVYYLLCLVIMYMLNKDYTRAKPRKRIERSRLLVGVL